MWDTLTTGADFLLPKNQEILLLSKKIFILTFFKMNISEKYIFILLFYLIKSFVYFQKLFFGKLIAHST